MKATEIDYKGSLAQKCVIWIALTFFCGALLAYVLIHGKWGWPLNISTDTGTWGELGDYLGGVINPTVGLLTIWLLTVSLNQTHREIMLTRQAVVDAKSAQEATEKALKEQNDLARGSRDFDNVVAMYSALEEIEGRIRKQSQKFFDHNQLMAFEEVQKELDIVVKKREKLMEIMYNKAGQLIKEYDQKN